MLFAEAIHLIDAGGIATGPKVGAGFVVALHPVYGDYRAFNQATGSSYSVGHKVNVWLHDSSELWEPVQGWLNYER